MFKGGRDQRKGISKAFGMSVQTDLQAGFNTVLSPTKNLAGLPDNFGSMELEPQSSQDEIGG